MAVEDAAYKGSRIGARPSQLLMHLVHCCFAAPIRSAALKHLSTPHLGFNSGASMGLLFVTLEDQVLLCRMDFIL